MRENFLTTEGAKQAQNSQGFFCILCEFSVRFASVVKILVAALPRYAINKTKINCTEVKNKY